MKLLNDLQKKYAIVDSRTQRILNVCVFSILLFWYLSLLQRLRMSSDVMFYRKSELLFTVTILFFFQAIFNKRFINTLLLALGLLIIGYFIYSYTYFFFDDNDWYKANYPKTAFLIQTGFHGCKIFFILILLTFLKLSRPQKDK